MTHLKGHWQLIALTCLVFALWTTPIVLPLKILVVYLHEVSHGLAAYLTGGTLEQITLSVQQGGVAITRGGNGFAILSAGYVGSLLIGVLLFLVALRTRADRFAMAVLGMATVLVTLLYLRGIFPMTFGAVTGLSMLAMARFLGQPANDLALRVIGLTSMIYVPYDIFSDTIARSHLRSDAWMLAEGYGGTAWLWGGLWLVISLAVIGLALRHGLGRTSNINFRQLSGKT